MNTQKRLERNFSIVKRNAELFLKTHFLRSYEKQINEKFNRVLIDAFSPSAQVSFPLPLP